MRGMLQHDYGVKAAGHALVHGRAQQLRRAAADPARPARRRSGSISSPAGRRWKSMFDAGRARRAALALHPQAVPRRLAARSRGCSRTTRRSSRTTTAAPGSSRSCTRWWCARTSIREHPWVGEEHLPAFCEARDLAVDGLYDTDALRVALPWLIDHVEETWRVFGKDFWAYGLEPNRPTFDAIGRYVHEQGLSPRVVSADELFRAWRWSETMIDPTTATAGRTSSSRRRPPTRCISSMRRRSP